MNDTALVTTSAVDPEVTAAIAIQQRLEPLKEALGIKDLTAQEVQLFAMVAQRSRLDPFAKQIYAIKRSGKVSYQTGIDGYRSIAARTGDYAGSDEASFEECPCGEAPPNHPGIARVVVHRIHSSGRVIDQVGIARWHELYPGSGENGRQWRQGPFNQLAKCAEANGLRKIFPTVLADIYITEEMDQAGPPQNGALVAAAAKPNAADRLAARREAIESGEAVNVTPTREELIDGMTNEQIGMVVSGRGPDEDIKGEAAADPAPAAANPAVSTAASTAPLKGYALFKARFRLALPEPTRQAVVDAGQALFGKAIPNLSLKATADWPLQDSDWKRLADRLALPDLPKGES